jgi:phage baseplate assembly protein W|tara:strand:+ start:352 stop:948 length:597 start_codon:yes stop_codon:yes gene_type:complete
MPNYLDPLTAQQLQANQEQAGLANYGAGFIPKFIAPIDLDPNISIGFTLPFGTTQTGPSFNASMTTIEAIRNNMVNLLLTSKGERLSNPNFGSNLKFVLFEQNDEAIILKIQDAINEAVSEFMPYVDIQDIDVDRYDGGVDQSANINVTVTFSINDGAESSAVGIPLTLADFQGGSGGTAQENFDLAANSLSAGGGGY